MKMICCICGFKWNLDDFDDTGDNGYVLCPDCEATEIMSDE